MFNMLGTISAQLMEMVFIPKQWYPSPDRKISPMPWFLPVTQAAFIVLTMLPRKARFKIAFPVLLLLLSHARNVSSGDALKDYTQAAVIFGFVLKFIDFGLLVKDGAVYKLKDRKAKEKQIKESVNGKDRPKGAIMTEGKRDIWQRFKDSVELWLFTMRGIGWNWEVGGIPKREPQSNG
jgi:hypothetical protein